MSKEPGYVASTESGKGYTKHSDQLVNGKKPVYLFDGKKILCDLEKIKVIGFKD